MKNIIEKKVKILSRHNQFFNIREPKIECDNINHIIKLKDSIINFLHGDLVNSKY